MSEKKGKYLSLEIAPVQGSIPSPIVAQDVPAEHHVCWGQNPSLALWLHVTGTAAFSELPKSTNQVLFLLDRFSAVLAEGSGGCGREQRGWSGFCSLHVPLRSLGGEVATCGLHRRGDGRGRPRAGACDGTKAAESGSAQRGGR